MVGQEPFIVDGSECCAVDGLETCLKGKQRADERADVRMKLDNPFACSFTCKLKYRE